MVSPSQSRAARALLGWTQPELSRRSGVSESTVWSFETEKRRPIAANLKVLQATFEAAGIVFIDDETGVGVVLRRDAGDPA